jgi:hypothetical protein
LLRTFVTNNTTLDFNTFHESTDIKIATYSYRVGTDIVILDFVPLKSLGFDNEFLGEGDLIILN